MCFSAEIMRYERNINQSTWTSLYLKKKNFLLLSMYCSKMCFIFYTRAHSLQYLLTNRNKKRTFKWIQSFRGINMTCSNRNEQSHWIWSTSTHICIANNTWFKNRYVRLTSRNKSESPISLNNFFFFEIILFTFDCSNTVCQLCLNVCT